MIEQILAMIFGPVAIVGSALVYSMLGLGVIVAGALIYGSRHWQTRTDELHARLIAARRSSVGPAHYHSSELRGLPAPVRRYFEAVLTHGQPMITAAIMKHTGTLNISETGHRWRPFSSTQFISARRPGFDWEARIEMLPGLPAFVHQAYIAGEYIHHAALFGLVPLVNVRGRPGGNHGELLRFLAEAVWYPTALLPSQGVCWAAVSDSSARATLQDGRASVALLFRFGADGLIQAVRAEARERTVLGTSTPVVWEGSWRAYEARDGMQIPIEGEVVWMLPEGPQPYWRSRITNIVYAFAS